MALKDVIQHQNWDLYLGPPQYDPAWVHAALASLQAAGSEQDAARAAAALQDAVGNRHGAVLFSVAVPAAGVLIAVVEVWRREAREQALVSLIDIMQTEIYPGYEIVDDGGGMVDVYEAIWARIRVGLPLLRANAQEKQPWRDNRLLARQVIDLLMNPE